jgi:hypothetical protein
MMNRRTFFNTASVAAALFTAAIVPGLAQGFGGGPGGPMGAQMGEMMTKMRQSRAFADPGVSSTSNLLTRSDVRNELMLNGRQSEALADLQSGFPAAIGQQMRDAFQKMRDELGGASPQNMSPEERQQFGEQMRTTMQEAQFAVQADQDKKAEALLTPAQLKRLHELDLQWRGPLAVADAKTNEKLNLTPEQQTKFTDMLKEFRAKQQEARGGMWGGGRGRPGAAQPGQAGQNGQTGANQDNANGQPPAGGPGGRRGFPTPEEMQTQMETSSKAILKLRKTTDEKALAVLTPEQQQQWKAMQGRVFTFRLNL